jgi:CSLREA domain-containing protein
MISSVLLRAGGLLALAILALVALGQAPSYAANITINTTTDELNSNGNCSLREAITAANTDAAVDACTAGSGADVITVPTGTYALTIVGTGEQNAADGDLDVFTNVTINGAGAASTIIDGEATGERIFSIESNNGPITVVIAGVTMRDAVGTSDGGAIDNSSSNSTVTLNSVVVDNNSGDDGAGIENDGVMTINDSTISNNQADSGDDGGGIRSSGTLTVNRSTITGNTAGSGGGGISNSGELTVNNTTITDNDAGADASGGGILNRGSTSIVNSTIADNSATGGGGGIGSDILETRSLPDSPDLYVSARVGDLVASGSGAFQQLPEVGMVNTIVANNETGGDCDAPVTTGGHNIDSDDTCGLTGTGDQPGIDPLVGALADNGGPTQTMALDAASPAVDTGDDAACLATDQRAIDRPQDGDEDGTAACDIGAFELEIQATPAPTGTPTLAPATEAPAELPETGGRAGDNGTPWAWLIAGALGALAALGSGLWMARRQTGI